MHRYRKVFHSALTRRALALALAGAGGLWLALAVVAAARAAPAATPPPTFVVNSTVDAIAAGPLGDATCDTVYPYPVAHKCTLRAAIMKANHYPGGGVTIQFSPLLNGAPISLTITPQGPQDDEALGDLNISQTTHIHGFVGGDGTTIDALALGDRVFHLAPGAVVDMSGLIIQNGTAGSQGGGGVLVDSGATLYLNEVDVRQNSDSSGQGGGGVRSQGTLTLSSISVDNNVSTGPGGGVANDGGVAVIELGAIYNNHSDYWGGGLFNAGPRLNIDRITVFSNTADNYGGGLAVETGTVTVTASTFYSNFTNLDGGGLEAFLDGHVNLLNSTLTANNAAGYGGGLDAEQSGVVSLYNATVTDNRADFFLTNNGRGGGLSNGGAGGVYLQNSLIAGNLASTPFFSSTIEAPDDCFSAIHSNGYNLVQFVPHPGCTLVGASTNLTGVDPNLGPLQYNGGETRTRALLLGSAAIDAGNPGGCTGPATVPLATDQRGYPRVANGAGTTRCDIGAFELQRTLELPLVRR